MGSEDLHGHLVPVYSDSSRRFLTLLTAFTQRLLVYFLNLITLSRVFLFRLIYLQHGKYVCWQLDQCSTSAKRLLHIIKPVYESAAATLKPCITVD